MKDVKIVSMGQRVKTKIGGIEAIITGASIRGYQMYEISYFASGEHKSTWIYDFEFEICPDKQPAGFKKPPIDEAILLREPQ